ncbi:hypothetical protein [Paenibacillus sp. MBLB4367]|uniref:hypothetical protein n=1 Tax=Paenibacillus sp. MBLB4367 TaxID=3384767 RepID=UPI003907F8CC
MLAVIGVLAAIALLTLFEFPSLVRQKRKKDAAVFAVFMAVAAAFGIAKSLRMPVPNPLEWIRYVFEPVGEYVFGWLP